MGFLFGKLIRTWLCSLGALALAGGPAVSAAHAKSVDRQARKDAEAKKRVRPNEETGRTPRPPPAHGPDSASHGTSNTTGSGFVAPCAAKPADSDSSNLDLCLTAALDGLPSATVRPTDDAPGSSSCNPSLHRPSYQAQAPPFDVDLNR